MHRRFSPAIRLALVPAAALLLSAILLPARPAMAGGADDAAGAALDAGEGVKKRGAGDFAVTGDLDFDLQNYINPDSDTDANAGVGNDDTFSQVLMRARASILWWVSDMTFGKVTLQTNRAFGAPGAAAAFQLFLYEGFMDAKLEDDGLELVIGRQVIEYDDGSFFSNNDAYLGTGTWPGPAANPAGFPLANTFDGVRLRWWNDTLDIEAFWSIFFEGAFDQSLAGDETQVFGAHATYRLPDLAVSAFFYGFIDQPGLLGFAGLDALVSPFYGFAPPSEIDHERYTIGVFVSNERELAGSNLSRPSRPIGGPGGGGSLASDVGTVLEMLNAQRLSYRVQFAYQFGNYNDQRIAAWSGRFKIGYDLGSPAISLEGGADSGDKTPVGGADGDKYTEFSAPFTNYSAQGSAQQIFAEALTAGNPRFAEVPFNRLFLAVNFLHDIMSGFILGVSLRAHWLHKATGRDGFIGRPSSYEVVPAGTTTALFRNWETVVTATLVIDQLFRLPYRTGLTLGFIFGFLKAGPAMSRVGFGDNSASVGVTVGAKF